MNYTIASGNYKASRVEPAPFASQPGSDPPCHRGRQVFRLPKNIPTGCYRDKYFVGSSFQEIKHYGMKNLGTPDIEIKDADSHGP